MKKSSPDTARSCLRSLAAFGAAALLFAFIHNRGDPWRSFGVYVTISLVEVFRAVLLIGIAASVLQIAIWCLNLLEKADQHSHPILPLRLKIIGIVAIDLWKSAWYWLRGWLMAFGSLRIRRLPDRLVPVSVSEECRLIVVLVPGTWNKARSLLKMKCLAERASASAKYLSLYEWNWRGSNDDLVRRESARQLAMEVKALMSAQQLLLVGHSHGGSVASLAAAELGRGSVLTIATPFVTVRQSREIPTRSRPLFWACLLASMTPMLMVFIHFLSAMLVSIGVLRPLIVWLYAIFGGSPVIQPSWNLTLWVFLTLVLPAVFLHVTRVRPNSFHLPMPPAGHIQIKCVDVTRDVIFDGLLAANRMHRLGAEWFRRQWSELKSLRQVVSTDVRVLAKMPLYFVCCLVSIDIVAQSWSSVGDLVGSMQEVSGKWFGSVHFLTAFIIVTATMRAALLTLSLPGVVAIVARNIIAGCGYMILTLAYASLSGISATKLVQSHVSVRRVPSREVAIVRARHRLKAPRPNSWKSHSEVLETCEMANVLRNEIAGALGRAPQRSTEFRH